MRKIIILSSLALIMSGCSNQPNCSSDDTKTILMEIVKEATLVTMSMQMGGNDFLAFIDTLRSSEPELDKTMHPRVWHGIMREKILDDIQNDNVENSLFRKQIARAYTRWDSAAYTLENIRSTRVDEKLKKCWCELDLVATNGYTVALEYSAQKIDSGELLVELME